MAQSAFNPNAAGKTTVPVVSITSVDSPYAPAAADIAGVGDEDVLLARAITGTPDLRSDLGWVEGG